MRPNNSPPHLVRFAARNLWLLLAMSFGSALGHIATTGMPLQIGALMDGSARSASQAGLFAFTEVGSLSAGMILISLVVIGPTRVALAGALLAALADLGLFVVRDFPMQLVLGSLAGLGFGLAYAATVAAGASSEDADRAYAIGVGGALLLVVAIMTILPFTSSQFGVLGVFACMTIFALLCMPLFLGFKGAAAARTTRPAPSRAALLKTPGAAGLLFSWTAFSTGTAMAYVFAERIGKNIGLTTTDIGLVLSSGVFIGVVGTALAALLSQHLSRRVALLSGLTGSAFACFLVSNCTTLIGFVAGIYLYWICTMFLYCFLLGTAAMLDESGRLGTLGSGAERLGYGAGAWIGGLLAQHISFTSTGTFGCAVCVTGILVGYPALFRALSHHTALPSLDARRGMS